MAKSRRTIRSKNMLIDQRKLDAALDLVVFRAEVFRGLDALVAAGGLHAPSRSAG